jgi:hypothetical protein
MELDREIKELILFIAFSSRLRLAFDNLVDKGETTKKPHTSFSGYFLILSALKLEVPCLNKLDEVCLFVKLFFISSSFLTMIMSFV